MKTYLLLISAAFFFNYSCSRNKKDDSSTSLKNSNVTEESKGLHGYISYSAAKPPAEYSYGMSFYSAVWPLIDKPLANFQIGLPGCWILPENKDVDFPLCPEGTLARTWKERGPTWSSVFQTIEGGLGYWRGNHFRYASPKFSMNGVPNCYDYEVASPGWSFFYHNKPLPDNKMGIAQISNRILVPPDGLTFQGKPNGQFLGYAWMALPLMDKHTYGDVPVGDQSWTLFLNSANFKGPVAYYIAETWTKVAKDYKPDVGHTLDCRPATMGGGAMEINTVPKAEYKASKDSVYTKIPALHFPVDDQNRTYLVQNVTYYSKSALFNEFKNWRDAMIETCDGSFNKTGSWNPPELSTRMPDFDQDGKIMEKVDNTFSTKIFPDNVFGIQWKKSKDGFGTFPQYFMKTFSGNPVAVSAEDVPKELTDHEFALAEKGEPYTSPDSGAWVNPGPASDPVTITLADGSQVTYAWYRFIDQPSLQQYDWSPEQKQKLQALIEKIQANWTNDKEYMAPQSKGDLVIFDEALLVVPPKEYEVGYVPIVIGQK